MNSALIKFWATLNWENMIKNEAYSDDVEACYRIAMNDYIYEPIDTRFCMAYNSEFDGWILLEASGSVIIKITNCGSMGKIGLIKE